MPINFLQYSPTYVEKTGAEVQSRRELIIEKYLGDDYRPEKGVTAKTIAEDLGIQNPTTVSMDLSAIRLAYDFLTGSEDRVKEIEVRAKKQKTDFSVSIVRAFIADRIRRWEQVSASPSVSKTEQASTSSDPFKALKMVAIDIERAFFERTRLTEELGARVDELTSENQNLKSLLEKERNKSSSLTAQLNRFVNFFREVYESPNFNIALAESVVAEEIASEEQRGKQEGHEEQKDLLEKFPMQCGSWARNAKAVVDKRFSKQWREITLPALRNSIEKVLMSLVENGPVDPKMLNVTKRTPRGSRAVKVGGGRHYVVYLLEKGALHILEFGHHDDYW